MCLDDRCRHPYTCDCQKQCGGQEDDLEESRPCPTCGAGTWPSEDFYCYVCGEDDNDG
ncbi:MAG TPA: hypothetical protein VMZ50_11165 [Phycisphaerae bacterium]|nr:hypothetical protein [Phycisphaerae bacterium]